MDKFLDKIRNNKKVKRFLLRKYIFLHNFSYAKISQLVVFLNDGIHPKHKIINYHKFFIDNISSEDDIIDLGCGNGFLTYDIAQKAKNITGIDIGEHKIAFAKKNFSRDNISYLQGDATQYQFNKRFDKIVLSNVLEHIEQRIPFLKGLRDLSDVILLRVPMIDRDWLAVYKKENGFEYRLDPSHYIEYTIDSLQEELRQSGWEMEKYSIQFGELWGVLKEHYDES